MSWTGKGCKKKEKRKRGLDSKIKKYKEKDQDMWEGRNMVSNDTQKGSNKNNWKDQKK